MAVTPAVVTRKNRSIGTKSRLHSKWPGRVGLHRTKLLPASPKRLNPDFFVLTIVRPARLISPKTADPVTAWRRVRSAKWLRLSLQLAILADRFWKSGDVAAGLKLRLDADAIILCGSNPVKIPFPPFGRHLGRGGLVEAKDEVLGWIVGKGAPCLLARGHLLSVMARMKLTEAHYILY